MLAVGLPCENREGNIPHGRFKGKQYLLTFNQKGGFMASKEEENRPGYKKIFRTRIRLRNGKVLIAKDCGLRAFAFWVKE